MMQLRRRWFRLCCLLLFVISVSVFYISRLGLPRYTKIAWPGYHGRGVGVSDRVKLIKSLYEAIKHDGASPFVTPDGITWTIRGDLVWKHPLENQLCILDVNTDPMVETDSAWYTGGFNWTNAKKTTPGVLNHYLYAKIHGYQYHFMHSPTIAGRDAAWLRIPAISVALQRGCRFVVYLDTDAILPHLRLPMEWLLNYWNITTDTIMASSQEPLYWLRKLWNTSQEEVNATYEEPFLSWTSGFDTRGRRAVNGGVLIIQNTPRTIEMLRRWKDCPTGSRYRGCEALAQGWPAEQGAFNEYVRYDFLNYIRELPCDEAHGYPNASIDCHGSLIRHYTLDKQMVAKAMDDIIARDIMESTQRLMLREKEHVYEEMHLDNSNV